MKQAAGFILVDTETHEEPTVLCLRAYSNWDFPKGLIEEGEFVPMAALRELEEETGYVLKDISLNKLHPFSQTPVSVTYGKGKNEKRVTLFVAALTNYEKDPVLPVNPELGKPEHDEWRWVKLSELESLLPKHFTPIALFLKDTVFKPR
tara:strand:+ start:240 stop:686 length:447 start_codon:yes stop_codon:yes gene_type:complete